MHALSNAYSRKLSSNLSLNESISQADTGFSERGCVGCRGCRYFILGYFVVGQIMRCADKIPMDKTPVKIVIEDKMLTILWDWEDKMLMLSKHLTYHTDDQVNRKSL